MQHPSDCLFVCLFGFQVYSLFSTAIGLIFMSICGLRSWMGKIFKILVMMGSWWINDLRYNVLQLFYGDRELTWFIPSYPQYYDQDYDQADFPRSAYQHNHQQQQHQKLVPHHVYYQDDETDEAASRYRTQYNQRSQAAFRLQSPTRHNYQQVDDVLPYAPPETRYKAPIVETRYNTRPMQSVCHQFL